MYYFIVNPNAHRGYGEKIWRKLERQIRDSGIEYEAHMTTGQGDARRLAAELTAEMAVRDDPSQILVMVGGDGTVNEVLNGLALDRPITLGYIPAGTGNDLARSLRLPKNPGRCLKRVLKPRCYQCLDYGILSYEEAQPVHRRFLVSSGIGLDAEVSHMLLDAARKSRRGWMTSGRLRYVLAGLRQLLVARPVKGYLLLDGVKKVEFNHIYFISSHIHAYEGGGFRFAPKADPGDGLLDICVVHNSSRRKLFPVLVDAFLGRMGSHRGVRLYRCKEASIHMERPMAVHVDGESCYSQTDIHLRCVERKLRVIV